MKNYLIGFFLIAISFPSDAERKHQQVTLPVVDRIEKGVEMPRALVDLREKSKPVNWASIVTQQQWLDLASDNERWNSDSKNDHTLFEWVQLKNPQPEHEFVKAFVRIMFCLDGADTAAASVLYFDLLRNSPTVVLNATEESLRELSVTVEKERTACLNGSTGAVVYQDFANIVADGARTINYLPDSGKADEARAALATWREKTTASDPQVVEHLAPVLSVLDANANRVLGTRPKKKR